MTTYIAVILIAAILFFILWENKREKARSGQQDTKKNKALWLLIGLLSIAAIVFPKVLNRIHDLERKHHL